MTRRFASIGFLLLIWMALCLSVGSSTECEEGYDGGVILAWVIEHNGPIARDSDGDGLKNFVETWVGSDPYNPDSDGDLLDDLVEIVDYETDPLTADCDGDGLDDGDEVLLHGTEPLCSDTDSDGLDDYEELQVYGTDPCEWDMDGDGFSDGYEVWFESDPNNNQDFPGQWPVDGCSGNVVPTGDGVGEVPADFALSDQFGNTVHLHDFCDHVVLIISGTTWCGACPYWAFQAQTWYETYRDEGFVVLYLLGEAGTRDNPREPDQDDLRSYADSKGLTYPVLSDPEFGQAGRFEVDHYIPSLTLLDRGPEVVIIDDDVTADDIAQLL